jgi:hypothetical protein
MGEMRDAYKMLVGKIEGKSNPENQGVDGKLI